jgi:hypothetical protein
MTTQEGELCVWGCFYCKPIRTLPKEEQIVNQGNTYSLIMPPTCPYEYVKIEGRYYKRDRGNIFDDMSDESGESCHDCGVIYGNVHHVGCDSERCPKCRGQILFDGNCGDMKFYKELPKSVTPRRVRKDVLRKYIEK